MLELYAISTVITVELVVKDAASKPAFIIKDDLREGWYSLSPWGVLRASFDGIAYVRQDDLEFVELGLIKRFDSKSYVFRVLLESGRSPAEEELDRRVQIGGVAPANNFGQGGGGEQAQLEEIPDIVKLNPSCELVPSDSVGLVLHPSRYYLIEFINNG